MLFYIFTPFLFSDLQTAIKMYKLAGEEKYLLWAVCSIQLQVLPTCFPPLSYAVYVLVCYASLRGNGYELKVKCHHMVDRWIESRVYLDQHGHCLEFVMC